MGILRRWQAKHLLLAWSAYWIVLAAVSLRGAIAAASRALAAEQGKGSMSASIDNGMLTLHAAGNGSTWSGSASLTSIALWIAGPPLILWLVWLVTRRSPSTMSDAERDYRIS